VTTSESAREPHNPFVATLIASAMMGADEKLGINPVHLDLRDLVDSFDALVITSGRNDRQVRAIAEEIEHLVEVALDVKPLRVEGLSDGEWVAMDYGDVVVHVFDEEAREYYDLEHLWNAAPSESLVR